MDNDHMSFDAGYCKLKTARQKKRLHKEDTDKRLRALLLLQKKLWLERRHLPMVPLEMPYQRGWVRVFRLRDDVARSSKATFFQTLLEKINTKAYSYEKSFVKKKRRKRIRIYVPREQWLKTFSEAEWKDSKCVLTEAEKQLFYLKEYVDKLTNTVKFRYTFVEPWRYVLQVKPNMITHAKLLDIDLEQQLQQIENHIEGHYLKPRIWNRIYCKRYHYRNRRREEQCKDLYKDKPLRDILYEANNNII